MRKRLLTAAVVQREDYDLAARIRDDLTRERGVDVHQLKRQLDDAIDLENYRVRILNLSSHAHCAVQTTLGRRAFPSTVHSLERMQEAARLRDQLKAAGEDPSSSDESKEVTYTSTLETNSIRVTATRCALQPLEHGNHSVLDRRRASSVFSSSSDEQR